MPFLVSMIPTACCWPEQGDVNTGWLLAVVVAFLCNNYLPDECIALKNILQVAADAVF